MGKPDLFSIVVFQPYQYYMPGMWIEGVVRMHSQESIKARAVRLKLSSEEYTHWTESRSTGSGKNRRTTTVHYSRRLILMNAYITLWGYPKHTDESTPHIPPGSYVFPFSVQIPPVDNLPPTCNLSHVGAATAHVLHRLIAYIDIPWAIDVETVHTLRVVPRIPLNSNPSLLVPVELEETKQIGCWCCVGGSVRVRARCLRLGVMPGEPLLCTAEIVNVSNREVVGVELSLEQHAVLHAEGHTRRHTGTVVSAEYPLKLGKGETFTNLNCTPGNTNFSVAVNTEAEASQVLMTQPFSLVVPADITPGFMGGAIVLGYELVFRVRLEGCCVFDIRLRFSPTMCTQIADVPLTAVPVPTLLNPSGQPRSATLLLPASDGMYPVYFSFDGMDYRPQEQLEQNKQVTYPCFYDPDPNVIPAALNNFNPAAMQAVATGGQNVQVVLAPPPIPMQMPAPMPMPMPMQMPAPMPMPMTGPEPPPYVNLQTPSEKQEKTGEVSA